MSDAFIFAPNSSDYSGFGMIGAIPATEIYHEEETNGYSEISLTVPIDSQGRHRYIRTGCVIAADVPVPYTPAIGEGGGINTVVETYTVSLSATAEEKQLYKTRTGDKKLKRTKWGEKVAVIQSNTDWSRWKVKTASHGTGWIATSALTAHQSVSVAPTLGSLADELGQSAVKTQYFRVYDVKRDMGKLNVKAEHISYDLNHDLTYFESNTEVSTNTALQGILNGCSNETAELYTIRTNIDSKLTQESSKLRNPINAIIDPDDGIAGRVNGAFVRDNFDLYLLAGMERYRGFRIEYGMNMTGLTYEEDWSDVVTRAVVTAQDKEGKQILISPAKYPDIYTNERIGDAMVLDMDREGHYFFESARANLGRKEPTIYPEYAEQYPVPRYTVIDSGAKESDKVGIKTVHAQMIEKAREAFEGGQDQPDVTLKVEFAKLSEDYRYKYLARLEQIRLWEIVRLVHPAHGIDTLARCVRIKWDCILEKVVEAEFVSIESYDYMRMKAASDGEIYDALITKDKEVVVMPAYTVG